MSRIEVDSLSFLDSYRYDGLYRVMEVRTWVQLALNTQIQWCYPGKGGQGQEWLQDLPVCPCCEFFISVGMSKANQS